MILKRTIYKPFAKRSYSQLRPLINQIKQDGVSENTRLNLKNYTQEMPFKIICFIFPNEVPGNKTKNIQIIAPENSFSAIKELVIKEYIKKTKDDKNTDFYLSKAGALFGILFQIHSDETAVFIIRHKIFPIRIRFLKLSWSIFLMLLYLVFLMVYFFPTKARSLLMSADFSQKQRSSSDAFLKPQTAFSKQQDFDNTAKAEETNNTVKHENSYTPEKTEERKTPSFLKAEYLEESSTASSDQSVTSLKITPKTENIYKSHGAPEEYHEGSLGEIPGHKVRSFEEIYRQKKTLEREVDELSLLRELNLASNHISDINSFMETALKILQSRFEEREIAFFMVDRNESSVLRIRSELKKNDIKHYEEAENSYEKIILNIGDEGKALNQSAAVIISTEKGSSLTAPLIDKGALIGALRLSSSDTADFNEKDKTMLLKLSKSIAVSLNNVTLYESAITDGLTGIYGHRHFQNILKEELTRAARYKEDLSLVILDIDHFKKFNDTWGHQAGDYVLKEFSKTLKHNIRNSDYCFRYGGEEFAILLVKTDKETAYEITEKIRKIISQKAFYYSSQKLNVTASSGISSLQKRVVSGHTLIEEADKALYQAKKNGRNKVITFHLNQQ